jgi:hypothetical protein
MSCHLVSELLSADEVYRHMNVKWLPHISAISPLTQVDSGTDCMPCVYTNVF